jgi:Meckel syndrome type 1 protein
MRPNKPLPAILALLGASLAAAACAPGGPYPSLAPRPIEKAMADSEELPEPAAVPDDAGLPARIEALAAQARRGETEYQAALPEAREAASKAGPSGSDSWIMAQQALSRLEAARATTGGALADLDALTLAEGSARQLSPADRERLETATRQAQALAERQRAEIVRLQARIGD